MVVPKASFATLTELTKRHTWILTPYCRKTKRNLHSLTKVPNGFNYKGFDPSDPCTDVLNNAGQDHKISNPILPWNTGFYAYSISGKEIPAFADFGKLINEENFLHNQGIVLH